MENEMSLPPSRVHEAALALPITERAELAYALLQTLKPPAAFSEDSPGFEDELARRVQAYESGEASAEDWETVSSRLRRSLPDRKST